MYDARIFINSLEQAREILSKNNFIFKGEYQIHDKIYSSLDPSLDMSRIFLRLRFIIKNIWDEKAVVVAIKNTENKETGKQSIIPLKKQFDSQKEGEYFIQQNYLDKFKFDYEFDRKGWQYDLNDDQVDLEDIEGNFSIEFKSKSIEGLKKLVKIFKISESDIIKGPSVVAIKEILKKF